MRKNLRALLGLLLALAMMLSLAACGEKQEEDPQKADAPVDHPDMVYTYESLKLDNTLLPNGISPMAYTQEGFYGMIYEEAVMPRPLMAAEPVAERQFSGENSNLWSESELREWLNGEFTEAFS